jgi:6-phosphofructokinase 1
MGRHAGWLTAAASLAGLSGDGPDLIYLPEVDFDMDQFVADVKRIYAANNNCIVAVSEGVHYADGTFVSEAKTSGTDGFGHAQLGGLAARLAEVVKAATGAKVRGIELSLLQRCAAHCASATDIEESFNSGKVAVESAIAGESGKMVGFRCDRSEGYKCEYVLFDLEKVANFEQKVPLSWITEDKSNVTEDFIRYCAPLIQGDLVMPMENGLPRFTKLKKVFAE